MHRPVAAFVSLLSAPILLLGLSPTVAAETPAPAVADPDVAKILSGIGEFTDLTKGLVDNERLSQPLPLIEVAPAAQDGLGLGTLFESGLHDVLADGATDLDSLDKSVTDEDIGGGRTVTLTSDAQQVGYDKVVDVTATFTKSIGDANLFLADDDPKLSLRIADGAALTLSLQTHLVFVLEDDSNFYLRKDDTSPQLTLAATAELADSADPEAALGILGIDVDGTLTYAAKIVGAIDDPDGDGRLAFTEPGGGHGELAAEGAVDGLFSFTMPTGQGDANKATGSFDVTAEELTGFTGSPISATVDLEWADLATGQPQLTVESSALQQIQAFQNMSARDLVSGVDQLANLINALRRTQGNLDLPFLRGSAAEVLDLSEHLRTWLAANTEPASAGESVAGLPTFASLQEMLTRLDELPGLPSGSDLTVSGASYDDAARKFRFTVGLTRDDSTGSPVSDTSGELTSSGSGVTYTKKTLTDPNASFTADELAGRVVQAGSSMGYIAGNTATTITLVTNGSAPDPQLGWASGGVPANGSAYRVQGSDAMTGNVEFGDLFEDAGGLTKANAVVPQATAVPRYSAQLKLVLDLRPPATGTGCDPDCPFEQTNIDGTTVLVTEQPLPAERFMIGTGYDLATGSLPISTAVDVNAGVGFVKVQLGGTLKVCAVGDPANCSGDPKDAGDMLKVTLKDVGDVSLPEAFRMLRDDPADPDDGPGDLVTVSGGAQVHADLTASVPGASGLPTLSATVSDPDVTDGTAPSVTTSGFDALSDFNLDTDNPKALLGQIIAGIRLLADQMGTLAPTAGPVKTAMETEIPVVGESLQDLVAAGESGQGTGVTYANQTIDGLARGVLRDTGKDFELSHQGRSVRVGTDVKVVLRAQGHNLVLAEPWAQPPATGTPYAFRSELEDLADQIAARPPDYLQDLLVMVNDSLGSDSPISFATKEIGGTPHVVVNLAWARDVSTSTPLTFELGGKDVVGLAGTGEASVGVDGSLEFGLALPLGDNLAPPTDPGNLLVTRTSGASLDLAADAEGALSGTLGPLNLSLGKPNSDEDQMVAQARYRLAFTGPTGSGDTVPLDEYVDGLDLTFNGGDPAPTANCAGVSSTDPMSLCARLPIYVNGQPLHAADADPSDPAQAAVLRLPRDPGGTTAADQIADAFDPTEATIDKNDNTSSPRLETPPNLADALADAVLDLKLLDGGVDGYLKLVEQGLSLASANGTMPLVGKDLQRGQAFVADVRTRLKEAVGPLATADFADADDMAAKAEALLDEKLDELLGDAAPNVTASCGAGPCGGGEAPASVTGLEVSVTVQKGNPTDGCTNSDLPAGVGTCLTAGAPLDMGLPGLSLTSLPGQNIEARLGFRIHLAFGVDTDDGFYVRTDEENQPEVQVGASIDTPADMQARLAFLKVGIQDAAWAQDDDKQAAPELDENAPDVLTANFKVDLHAKGAPACWSSCATGTTRISGADLLSLTEVLDARLDGGVNIHWRFDAGIDPALPGMVGRFNLTWNFDGVIVGPGGLQTDGLDVGFDQLHLDVGEFFGSVLRPILSEIQRFTSPLKPIIDVLYAEIPVLSELSQAVGGDPVTLLSLAESWNTLADGPDLTLVKRLLQVVKLIGELPAGGSLIPIGTFDIDADAAKTVENTPDAFSTLVPSLTPPGGGDLKDEVENEAGAAGFFAGTDDEAGLTFPVLDEPATLFGLIMGQDVELVEFDSGPLRLGFDYNQSFGPVYAPPPVMMTISGSVGVEARVVAGFDTYGLRKAVEIGKPDLQILDSLYLKTTDDETGKPIPVVTLTGRLGAGAEVNLVAIKAGVQGGIFLTISLNWADPTNDGKFRFSEFLQAAVHNPLCLFNMDGELGLFLKVYVTLGISPFSVSFDFTLAEITLLDFSIKPDCTPPDPVLAGDLDSTLVVHVGALASKRGPDWPADGKTEKVKITQLHDYPENGDPVFKGFEVQALGFTKRHLSSDYTGVLVDGRGYGGTLDVTLLGDGDAGADAEGGDSSPFTKAAYIFGAEGNVDDDPDGVGDKIHAGVGPTFISAGGGNDEITTQDGFDGPAAVIAGGSGNDRITTGGADNWVAGDGALSSDTTGYLGGTQVPDPSTVDHPASVIAIGGGADQIAVGRGKTTIWGAGGADTIGVASDDPRVEPSTPPVSPLRSQGVVVIGGAGSDRISTASGADEIYTGVFKTATGEDTAGSIDLETIGDPTALNTVDSGAGADFVYGSRDIDRIVGRSKPGETLNVRAGGENDVVVGGHGTDKLFGGPDDDWVVAEPADVKGSGPNADQPGTNDGFGPTWNVTLQPLPDGVDPSPKLMGGGDGKDHLVGGRGPATMYGDRYHTDQQCELGADPESTPPSESLFDDESPGPDRILGGPGTDVVLAGGENDWATAFAGDDRVCGQSGGDKLQAGADTDLVFGGSGSDHGYGESGTDKVFGNDGADGVYGGDGEDIVEGNDGADDAFGDAGSDLVLGGTRKADARDVGHDDVFGGPGLDVLFGDNGDRSVEAGTRPVRPGVIGAVAYDLDGENAEAGDDDTVAGGAGDDVAFGGLDADQVFGNEGDDHLQGNNGGDTLSGNTGEDEIVGGSAEATGPDDGTGRPDGRDLISGGGGPDLVLGDNGQVTFGATESSSPVLHGRGFAAGHEVALLDLGASPVAGTSGGDLVAGDTGNDVILGQGGPDRLRGNADDDYAEGGPAVDWVEGNGSADDLVGGSSTPAGGSEPGTGDAAASGQPDGADVLWGGPGDDTAFGDNGAFLRGAGSLATKLYERVGASGDSRMAQRRALPYDLGDGVATPNASLFGADWVSGGADPDVLFGQDGADGISGGPADDYAEGNGDSDVIRGDAPLTAGSDNPGFVVPVRPDANWLGEDDDTTPELLDGSGPDGQDDLVGGSSRQRFRDDGDEIEGNGEADVELGDNGTLLRVVEGDDGAAAEVLDLSRYPEDTAPPAGAFKLRTHDVDAPGDNGTTRFCFESLPECEPGHASGPDGLWGDDGDDRMWGQDGDDEVFGEDGHDDLFGELGDDELWGGFGEDAILGDRGGVLGEYVDASDDLTFTVTFTQVPAETYVGLPVGTLDRRTDLLADTEAGNWVFSDASPAPHDGLTEGGSDRIRGGPDRDSIHAGFGDDLANGDSGGDEVFGDDGADLLWGGRGCDPNLGDTCTEPDLADRDDDNDITNGERWVDHVFGGTGATSGPSLEGALGADLLDWNPRGSYDEGTGCTTDPWPEETPGTTLDPCAWFEMTDKDDADPANNQHHHGTDWVYGGWDRDVLQADVGENGPNPGDRLLDWAGAYNLYSHCNAAYGGFNDVRQQSPAMNDWLTKLAYGAGAGRDGDDSSASGSSAFRELAYVYHKDIKDHGSGKAYPTTPGHFDDPVACSD